MHHDPRTSHVKARVNAVRPIADALLSLCEGALHEIDKSYAMNKNTAFFRLMPMLRETNPDAIQVYEEGVRKIVLFAKLGKKGRAVEVATRYAHKLAREYANF